MNEIKINGKLVDARELLSQLFSDGCRPSLRWLSTQTKARDIFRVFELLARISRHASPAVGKP